MVSVILEKVFDMTKKWKGRVCNSKPILDWMITEKWNICGK